MLHTTSNHKLPTGHANWATYRREQIQVSCAHAPWYYSLYVFLCAKKNGLPTDRSVPQCAGFVWCTQSNVSSTHINLTSISANSGSQALSCASWLRVKHLAIYNSQATFARTHLRKADTMTQCAHVAWLQWCKHATPKRSRCHSHCNNT